MERTKVISFFSETRCSERVVMLQRWVGTVGNRRSVVALTKDKGDEQPHLWSYPMNCGTFYL